MSSTMSTRDKRVSASACIPRVLEPGCVLLSRLLSRTSREPRVWRVRADVVRLALLEVIQIHEEAAVGVSAQFRRAGDIVPLEAFSPSRAVWGYSHGTEDCRIKRVVPLQHLYRIHEALFFPHRQLRSESGERSGALFLHPLAESVGGSLGTRPLSSPRRRATRCADTHCPARSDMQARRRDCPCSFPRRRGER